MYQSAIRNQHVLEGKSLSIKETTGNIFSLESQSEDECTITLWQYYDELNAIHPQNYNCL